MSHIVENYGKVLDEVDYVQTFKALRLRYNQHQDKLKDREKSSLDRSVNNTCLFPLNLCSYRIHQTKMKILQNTFSTEQAIIC